MVIKHALLSEKSVDLIEKENKIVFRVDARANKSEVKADVERLYGLKVATINTLYDMRGNKKAFVKFEKKGAAAELATKLNIL